MFALKTGQGRDHFITIPHSHDHAIIDRFHQGLFVDIEPNQGFPSYQTHESPVLLVTTMNADPISSTSAYGKPSITLLLNTFG